MFSQILRIIPQLDTSQLASMERTLSGRFSTVTRKFGAGLKAALKGSILGLSLGLIAKLLSPLTEVEERIKSLLGQGASTSDLADKFGTSEGNVLRMQAVGASLGLKPEELTKLIEKFQSSVEKARIEMATPGTTLSGDAAAVSNFINEKDTLKAFSAFMSGLREASPQVRQNAEREVYGERLHGAERRFLESNLQAQATRVGIPSAEALDAAGKKAASLSLYQDELQAGNDARNLIANTGQLTAKMIQSIEESRQRDAAAQQRQLEQYELFKRGSVGLEKIGLLVDEVRNGVVKIVGWTVGTIVPFFDSTIIPFFKSLSKSSWLRGILPRGDR